MPDAKRNRPGCDGAAPTSLGGDTGQDTAPIAFDLEHLTAAVATLNRQRIDHGCTCRAGAAFVLLPGGWFQCGTTHDDGCPAVGGGR